MVSGRPSPTTRPPAGAEARLARVGIPTRFALHQNQPNPFSIRTTLRFDLPRAERVTLDLWDVQGRRVARLANGVFPAGYHSIEWDRRSGAGLAAPGVYVYRLVAGSFRDRKKMVLLP